MRTVDPVAVIVGGGVLVLDPAVTTVPGPAVPLPAVAVPAVAAVVPVAAGGALTLPRGAGVVPENVALDAAPGSGASSGRAGAALVGRGCVASPALPAPDPPPQPAALRTATPASTSKCVRIIASSSYPRPTVDLVRANVEWQPSLFAGERCVIDSSYDGLMRLQLDDRSWLDYCPGWLCGSDAMFDELAAQARWQQRTVHMYDRVLPEPRLTAGWSTDVDDGLPGMLGTMAGALSDRYGVNFDRIWVNLYRDGADSVAWHGDRNRLVITNPIVATVSLGSRRRFLLRPRGTTTALQTLEPGHGDLVVMGGACQHDWEHTVPKTAKRVGPRMSVTIRHSEPAPGERRLTEPTSSEPGHVW